MKKTFGVAGGGQRAAELVRLLKQDGYTVSAYGVATLEQPPESAETLEQPPESVRTPGQPLESAGTPKQAPESVGTLEQVLSADAVILPVPLFGADGKFHCPGASLTAGELLSHFRAGQAVFAGLIPEDVASQARRAGVSMADYMKQEPMAIENAAATADAALCLTVTRTRETLAGKRCMVLGFGRIGKLLCQRLRGMGAEVTAAARNPNDRAWIRVFGLHALDTACLAGSLSPFHIVYNTIPAPLLDSELLRELPDDCFLMDLASRPCVDTEAVSRHGVAYLWARGLPGRIVPRGAAAILRDTVCQLLRELG